MKPHKIRRKGRLRALTRRRRGETLVEILVSLALLAMIVLLVGSMLLEAFTLTARSRRRAENTYAAVDSAVTQEPAAFGDSASVRVSGYGSGAVSGAYVSGGAGAGTDGREEMWRFVPQN